MKKIILWTILLCVGAAAAGLSVILYASANLPPVEIIQQRKVSQSTKIYDRTGEVLLFEIHGEEKRTIVDGSEISQFMKDAVVSVEDASFYTNPAFDWRGILRAVFINISRGKALQGGSTITQQLAKKAFLSDERTITRKIKELILASRLEERYTKDEILTHYLNQIPFGSNAYGVESASFMFFKKHAKDLSLNEAAALAALPKAPSYYSPWGNHLDELIKRKDFVLKRMSELGYIDELQLEEALSSKLAFAEQPRNTIKAPHFVMYVEEYLNRKYGEDLLKKGGLTVTTTLNWDIQKIAEEVVKEGVKRNTELYGGKNAALVAEDPKTGQILAMVGSADFFDIENEGNFNVATQGLRQPGSTFKPFAYITAFEKGFTPETILWDVETEFDTTGDPRKSYKPGNNDGLFRGPVLMKEALALSLNIPSVKTLYLAGLYDTIKTAEGFGITTLKDRSRFGLSLVLGGGEVSLLELVNAYSVFANDGVKNESAVILKVTDSRGRVLEEYKKEGVEIFSRQNIRLINDILSDVDLRAGLFRNSLGLTKIPGHQVALKTGTTNDYVDAWSIGYSPNLVVGVWVGNNRREPLKSKGGSILAAIPIWHAFTSKILPSMEPETFPKPEPIRGNLPVLNAELPDSDFHEILFHLKKFGDSQYAPWEEGLAKWLEVNSPDTSRFRKTSENSESTHLNSLQINIKKPTSGEFVGEKPVLEFSISSQSKIIGVEVFINNLEVLRESTEKEGGEYSFIKDLSGVDLESQNLLTIKATDKNGVENKKQVIFFK